MGITRVAVLGAGVMGPGIAQVASQIGQFEVIIYALKQGSIRRALTNIACSLEQFEAKGKLTTQGKEQVLSRIHGTLDLKEAVCTSDFIIEAITENISKKKKLLNEISKLANDSTIIATNTSSLSITEMAKALNRPQNFCGLHFFNPPQLMRLVEVIKGEMTSIETMQTVQEMAKKLGKESVLVQTDRQGFIVNRILFPAIKESVHLFFEGTASRDDIDKAIKLGLNWPMGPLMLSDYIGIDTVLAIVETFDKTPSNSECSEGLKQMVAAGQLGRKTGRGFYDWRH